MNRLTIDNFISFDPDWEISQYKILSGIKEYSAQFNKNKLYPALAELINISTRLETIVNNNSDIKLWVPKIIKSGEVRNRNIIYETADKLVNEKEYLHELINWALPHINLLIEEGLILYEFVEENMEIAPVGHLPEFKEEGYFFIPDNLKQILIINKYECSLFSSGKKPMRSLKTRIVKTIEQSKISQSYETIKFDVMRTNRELNNQAAYICETDLEFPFAETIFPIAKSKLLAILSK